MSPAERFRDRIKPLIDAGTVVYLGTHRLDSSNLPVGPVSGWDEFYAAVDKKPAGDPVTQED